VAVSQEGNVALVDLGTLQTVLSFKASLTSISKVYIDTAQRRMITITRGLTLYHWGSHGQDYDTEAAFKVWDLDAERPIASYSDFKQDIRDSALSESGGLFAAASMDGTAILYDLATYRVSRKFTPGHSVSAIAISEHHDSVALGYDNTVAIYRLSEGGSMRASYRLEAPIQSIAFASSAPLVASTSADRKIIVNNVLLGEQIVLAGHTMPPTSAIFSSQDHRLFSISKDNSMRLWNVGPIKWARLLGKHDQRAQRPLLIPGSEHFVTSDRDGHAEHGSVMMWDVVKGERIA
jgi:WD40 repeat protein